MAQTIKLKRSATEGKAPSTSDLALGELAINTYDGRVFFEKNDGSATIEHILTTDSITTGSITLTGTVTTGTLTLSGLSAQNSEATSLMINGSGVVGTRELGSNAFTSTTIGTTTNALTDGTGISDFSFDGSGTATISTDDGAIVHDNLSGFVANEHIDHSSVSITAGTGLNGGGTIASTRTLNVDDEYLNTSLNSATGSYLTTVDISSNTNLAVSDTTEVNMILSGDTISAELIGGVVSGSAQITNIANSQLAGSIANGKLANSAITIMGTSTSLGGSFSTANVVSALANTAVSNESLNSATGSYITAVRSVTAGGNTLASGETLAFTAGSNVSISESGGAVTITSTDTNTQLSTSDVRGKFSAGEGIDISSGEISGEDASTSNKGIVELATTAETTTGTDTARAVTPDGLKDGYQGSTNVTTLGTIATGTWNGTAIDKTYLDDEVLNTSLNSATGSYQLQPSEGAFANGDKTKLDGIDTSADVTDATTVKAALNGNLGTLTLGDSNDTVSIPGNLSVAGTTTTITTTTVQLDDNILELNGGGTADGGIYVRDAEAGTTVTGSLIWNTGDDKWTAGPKGSEDTIVLATATQTLTNKTLTSPDVNSPDIDGGNIDGATIATSDITVGSGKTLNVSGGTLTTSTAQKVAIIGGGDTDDLSEGSSNLYHTTARVRGALSAGEGIDFSSGEISGEDASTSNKGIVELATTAETTTGTDTARAVTPDGLKDGYQGSTNVTTLGTIATGTWNGTVIDKAYLDDEVLNTSLNTFTASNANTSLNSATGSYATGDNFDNDATYASLRAQGTTKGDVGLGNVENTALSTYTGNGGALDNQYITNGAGYTTNVGDITGITTAANSGLAGGATSGTPSLTLDIDNLAANTKPDVSEDDMAFLDYDGGNNVTKVTGIRNFLSASIDGTTLEQDSSSKRIKAKTAAIANGGTGLATADQIYDFVIGLGYSTTTGTVDTSGTPADNDYAKFTDANTVEGRSYTEVKTDLSLNNVENTAVSTWAGTSNITTLGTIGTGTWNGTAIDTAYLDTTLTSQTSILNTSLVTGRDAHNQIKFSTDDEIIFRVGDADGVTMKASGEIEATSLDISGGITVGGDAEFDEHLKLNDSKKLILGNSEKMEIYSPGTHFYIASTATNEDIIFKGNDGGSTITALTLDMSNGGSATFRDDIDFGGKITQTGTTANTFAGRVDVDDSTQSTSKTTGALVVDGGVGIVKTLSVGEDVVAYASSDERYKDFITPIENPNEKIKLLSGNTFTWNDKHEVFKGKKDIGVIAQEIEKVLPEIVETRDNGYKAVKYEKIVALLIESNKELIKRVEDLESALSVEKGRD